MRPCDPELLVEFDERTKRLTLDGGGRVLEADLVGRQVVTLVGRAIADCRHRGCLVERAVGEDGGRLRRVRVPLRALFGKGRKLEPLRRLVRFLDDPANGRSVRKRRDVRTRSGVAHP